MKYSTDLINFVSCLLYGTEKEPIDLKTAAFDIQEWEKDGMELPNDITPEKYMLLWNELIKTEVAQ